MVCLEELYENQEKVSKYIKRIPIPKKTVGLTIEEAENKKFYEGTKRLKRKCLGLFGHPFTFGIFRPKTIKSLDEMVDILKEMEICSSSEEGKQIIESFENLEIPYSSIGPRTLRFESVNNSQDKKAIRVSAHYYGLY